MEKEDIILEQIKQLTKIIHTRDEELYNYIRERVKEISKYIEKLEKNFDDKFKLFEAKITKVYMTLDSTQATINQHEYDIKRLQGELTDHYRMHTKLNKKDEKKENRIWNYIIPTATGLTVAIIPFLLRGCGQ